MASASENTIEIIFKAVDEFTETLDDVSGKISDFGKGIQDMASPFADMGKQVLGLDAALNTAVVAGLSAASAKAGEFKQAMNEINVIGKFTPEIFAELQKKSLDAFDSIRSTDMEGYMRALNQTVAFGVTEIPEIFEAIRIGEQLSIAGTAKLDETIVGLLGTMNAYGATQAETAKYADIFFQITQDGNASVADLSAYLSQVTSTAAGAKIPFETIGAAIAALTAQGVPASQAITSINTAIGGIINPTAEAKKLMDDLGIQYGATGLQAIGFEGVLKQIYEKTGGNIDVITKLITTVEGQKSALLLGADAAGKFAGSLENMGNVSGAAAEGVKRSTNEMEQTLQLLVNAWDKMQTQIGQKIPSFNANIIGPFTEIFKNIGKSVDAGSLDEVFDVINKFGEKLKKYLYDIANALPDAFKQVDFSKLIESYNQLGASFSNLFKGIDLTTPEGLAKAIQLLSDSFATVNTATSGIIDAFPEIVEKIKDLINWFNSLDAEIIKSAGEFWGFSIGAEKVGSILGDVGSTISGIAIAWGPVTGVLLSLKNGFIALGGALSGLAIPLAGAVTAIGGLLYFTDDKVKGSVDGAAQSFLAWADKIVDWTGTHNEAGESADEVTAKIIAETKAMQENREKTENVKKAISELSDTMDGITNAKHLISLEYSTTSLPEQAEKISLALEELTEKKRILEIGLKDATGEERKKIFAGIQEIDQSISALSDKETQIQIDLDTRSAEEILNDPEGYFYKGDPPVIPIETKAKTEPAKKDVELLIVEMNGKELTFEVAINKESATKSKEELEKIVPPEKQLQIMAEIDIAQIESETEKFKSIQETIQSKFEWKAKLDIAEVEANTAILEKSMENINTMFTESSSLISDAFGLLGSLDFGSAGSIDIFRLVKEQIREQNDLQREALGLQKEITESQIRLNEAKQKALLMGKPMFEITVDGSGLQTHLESILYSIMQFAQEKATAEGLESLLGL